jgi:squalene-hopene/tetraprenyl-beta-curcumene cyclase
MATPRHDHEAMDVSMGALRMTILDIDVEAFKETLENTRQALIRARNTKGHWEGKLSSSALSTATAVCALATADPAGQAERITRGLDWLSRNRNEDGGFGDSTDSPSNLSTTVLARAAFAAADRTGGRSEDLEPLENWLCRHAGGTSAEHLERAVTERYGKDRTFSAPILTMCAISGLLGEGRQAWRRVRPLPFELAVLPHRMLSRLNLSVVSYALPALIAIGQARYHHLPPFNPLARLIRMSTRAKTLKLLERIQPSSGGFLEAVPLTSFVVMSLAAADHEDHPVVNRSVRFLEQSQREDGSWPIDENLATWVTTLSVNGLAGSGILKTLLREGDREEIAEWILRQQFLDEHPYSHAAPGGWAWTDLPGGVPDADDTAGALLALRNLDVQGEHTGAAACAGIRWLFGLQNRDGGIPTFCRGWGKLPFDRSSADLTAHALAYMAAWSADDRLPKDLRTQIVKKIRRGLNYLMKNQRDDGAWVPLWFGNQGAPGEENPAYGTAQVVHALADPLLLGEPGTSAMLERGVDWLRSAQDGAGGFGGAPGIPPTIEETALAVKALAKTLSLEELDEIDWGNRIRPHLSRGISWLIDQTGRGTVMRAAPIGLYFAKLWYFEALYPLIFTVAALEQADRHCSPAGHAPTSWKEEGE